MQVFCWLLYVCSYVCVSRSINHRLKGNNWMDTITNNGKVSYDSNCQRQVTGKHNRSSSIKSFGPFYLHGLTSIPAWISIQIHYKEQKEIIYSFPNIKGATIDVWEWISNLYPKLDSGCNYLLRLKLNHASKRDSLCFVKQTDARNKTDTMRIRTNIQKKIADANRMRHFRPSTYILKGHHHRGYCHVCVGILYLYLYHQSCSYQGK